MAAQILTQKYLKSIFEYKNGELYWKIKPAPNVEIGMLAGGYDAYGYRVVKVKDSPKKVHRIIFMMEYGWLPKAIDHIDGNKANNKLENLREASVVENGYNRKISKNNTSGIKGVHFNKRDKLWIVSLNVNGKDIYLGCYKDFELAEAVSIEARNKYHGEFARHC